MPNVPRELTPRCCFSGFRDRLSGDEEIVQVRPPAGRSGEASALFRLGRRWTDARNVAHDIKGMNCVASLAWFAPLLISQNVSGRTDLFTAEDEGTVSDNEHLSHKVSFSRRPLGGTTEFKRLFAGASHASLSYDSETGLPSRLEYSLHPDSDDGRSIPVRIEYSDFRSVSGLTVPFRIEKYFNHSLQLIVTATEITIK